MKEFNRITSRENSLIKLISGLQTSAKKRKESGLFVIEGLRICCDAYDNGIRFDKLIICETAMEKYPEKVDIFSKNSSNCFIVPDSLFKKISDTSSPQGILAVCKREEIKEIEINPSGKYIALENIADPSNLGAVARTAEALGVSGIVVTDGGCDPYSPKALRASMGTLLRMPVIITDSLPDFLKNSKFISNACVVDRSALPITEVKFSGGSILLIGNEANGLLKQTADSCNKKITIPMSGRAESLNASVAAAVAMWEMMK